MKTINLVMGMLIGSVLMYLALKQAWNMDVHDPGVHEKPDWHWPDSLDALIAAPDNHQLVYEDSTLRIHSVTIAPAVLPRSILARAKLFFG